jgi:hypothetical protein
LRPIQRGAVTALVYLSARTKQALRFPALYLPNSQFQKTYIQV